MRIIAGSLGGRQFNSPKGHRTHPMSDRVRGALFNALGDISDLKVLDAFAGSGALSIESISRGAESVIAIDIDKSAAETIKSNVTQLGLQQKIKAIRANASGWSDNNPDIKFDIVIAAPPYDDLQLPVVIKIIRHLKTDGIFVLDWPGKLEQPQLDGLKIVHNKNFGDAQLVFYQTIS
ncbi:MAG TPA: RsmD family RNA methyltransferase [Candidatus Saccharimonadales bacterium]|nr:RsmD family RNA methyltransferase [Candidatus Saccharimonadales bacterium]